MLWSHMTLGSKPVNRNLVNQIGVDIPRHVYTWEFSKIKSSSLAWLHLFYETLTRVLHLNVVITLNASAKIKYQL